MHLCRQLLFLLETGISTEQLLRPLIVLTLVIIHATILSSDEPNLVNLHHFPHLIHLDLLLLAIRKYAIQLGGMLVIHFFDTFFLTHFIIRWNSCKRLTKLCRSHSIFGGTSMKFTKWQCVKKKTLKSVSIFSFSLWSDNKWLFEVQN